jgi:hypothetical protein
LNVAAGEVVHPVVAAELIATGPKYAALQAA